MVGDHAEFRRHGAAFKVEALDHVVEIRAFEVEHRKDLCRVVLVQILDVRTHENRVGHIVNAGATVLLDNQELVVFAEFTEAIALLLRRDDTARSVKVKHSCAKRTYALAEPLDRLDRVLRNDVANGATALDFDFAEIHFKVQLDARARLQDDFDDFGFAV